jgi:hypothetical protein
MMLSAFLSDCEVWANDQTPALKEVSIRDQIFSQEHFFDLKENIFNKSKVDFNKGWLGIFMENQEGKGVRVGTVIEGSPAHTCGLQKGDIITKADGKELNENDDSNLVRFKKIMEETGKGNVVTLTVLRNDIEMEFRPELIPKFLDIADNLDKHQEKTFSSSHSFVMKEISDRAKERNFNEDESFLKFILNDEEFKNKFMETMQRIGEETYVREGSHSLNTTNIFRLSLIDHLMTHPLDVPYYSEVLFSHLVNKNILQSLSYAAELLDLAPYLPPQLDRATISENVSITNDKFFQKDNQDDNPSSQELIENILHTIIKSLELREESLNNLTQAELAFLYEDSQKIFLNEEDVEADVMERFLETAVRVNLAMLIESSLIVIDSIPFKRLQGMTQETPGLRQFNLKDSEIITNISPETVQRDCSEEGEMKSRSGFGGDILFIQEVSGIGKIVVGGPGTTYYYDDAAFIIDVGGDDYYFNNAGASRPENPISICIDLSGNDIYISRSSYSQGTARFGTGILLDIEGDDRYMGSEYSQGFGLFGIGLLYDVNGDDSYNAETLCQGGGLFGVGFLRDKGGNDTYFSRMLSQGIGLTKGIGCLLDITGNDVYFAGAKYQDFRDEERSFKSLAQGFSIGIRPNNNTVGASGGIGVLIDKGGNDTYHGDYFAQGSSYYFSLGMLYDKSGYDSYYAGRYSQGAGIHSSIGILKDHEGDDLYNAYFGVSQGCGYDTGIGYLIDHKGNDYYKSNFMSQGVGGEKSLGVLSDFEGNDHYSANNESQGYSYTSKNETFFGIGILSDIGGDSDIFNKGAKNDTLMYQTNAGILMNKR